MPAHICTTCGTQYPPADIPPRTCSICAEERQYVNPLGQAWTTMEALARTHRNAFAEHEPNLLGIGTTPAFAIGQRALLVRTPAGNVLWDCISFLDPATQQIVAALGGIQAIAISHPHYYAAMGAWSRAFGNAPILLHAADRRWVMAPDPAIIFWDGETHETAPRPHPAPPRRPFRRRHGAALGGRRRRGRGAAVGRHRAGRPGQAGELHAQLPRPDPARRRHRARDRGEAGPLEVRADLRRLVGPNHPQPAASRRSPIRCAAISTR